MKTRSNSNYTNMYKVDICKEKEELFSFFRETLDKNTDIVLCVSGGPDSMFMARCVVDFLALPGPHVHTLKVVYFDHKQRDTTRDRATIYTFFSQEIVRIGRFTGTKKAREAELRKARREFIEDQIGNLANPVVITGHNLTDRIETTLLNMKRGAHLVGMSPLPRIQQKTAFQSNKSYTLLRPLVSIDKRTIERYCAALHIPYVIDETNTDITLSERNKIRYELLPMLGGDKPGAPLYRSFLTLYDALSVIDNTVDLFPLTPSPYRDAQGYYTVQPIPESPKQVELLFQALHIYANVSSATLTEFATFFGKSSGRKQYRGRYFFNAHGKAYAIKASNAFWKKHIVDQIEIPRTGAYVIGGFTWTITQDCVGGTIRFPRPDDIWKGKPLNKYFIAHKIPVFRRNMVPLVERDGKIIALYPVHHEKCFI